MSVHKSGFCQSCWSPFSSRLSWGTVKPNWVQFMEKGIDCVYNIRGSLSGSLCQHDFCWPWVVGMLIKYWLILNWYNWSNISWVITNSWPVLNWALVITHLLICWTDTQTFTSAIYQLTLNQYDGWYSTVLALDQCQLRAGINWDCPLNTWMKNIRWKSKKWNIVSGTSIICSDEYGHLNLCGECGTLRIKTRRIIIKMEVERMIKNSKYHHNIKADVWPYHYKQHSM